MSARVGPCSSVLRSGVRVPLRLATAMAIGFRESLPRAKSFWTSRTPYATIDRRRRPSFFHTFHQLRMDSTITVRRLATAILLPLLLWLLQ